MIWAPSGLERSVTQIVSGMVAEAADICREDSIGSLKYPEFCFQRKGASESCTAIGM